jgi:hypothetical protein
LAVHAPIAQALEDAVGALGVAFFLHASRTDR